MAAVVFVGCADLDYNEASNRDEDWTPILKGKLVNLLNADILSGGQHHSVV